MNKKVKVKICVTAQEFLGPDGIAILRDKALEEISWEKQLHFFNQIKDQKLSEVSPAQRGWMIGIKKMTARIQKEKELMPRY